MPQFHLVRHAQASFGAANYDKLSPLGQRQARWLGEYYREHGISFDALVTGAMQRHSETAYGILDNRGNGLTADIHPGLNEFDARAVTGAYLDAHPEDALVEGAPRADYYRLLVKAMGAWRTGNLDGALAESWGDFQDRVSDAMAHIQRHHAGCKRVLIVSSGGAIATWLHHMLQAADATVAELQMQIRNSSISEGFFNRSVLRLQTFNRVPHLDRSDRCDAITYS